MDPIFYDEEGQLWPPASAALAFVKDYGGRGDSNFNGALVEICGMADEFISTVIVEGNLLGYDLYCRASELIPINEYSKQIIDSFTDSAPPVYAPEVYDLWAQLNRIGISVHVDSVAAWSPEQVVRVRSYANAVEGAKENAQAAPLSAGVYLPPKPEFLP